MHESAPSQAAVEPLGELRERLRGWWQRAATQAALAARSLPPRTALRRREERALRLPGGEDGLVARGDEPRDRSRSMRPGASRGAAETRVERRPAPHASEILLLLRESLLRVAAVGRGASRRAWSSDGLGRVDGFEEAADSKLASTLRALHAEPPAERDLPGVEFELPGWTREGRPEQAGEASDRIEAPHPREASSRDPGCRELSEAQHDLADALERLQRRPSRWSA